MLPPFLRSIQPQLLAAFVIFLTLFAGNKLKTSEEVPSARQAKPLAPRPKVILLWNAFFGDPLYGVKETGTAVFRETDCPHVCHLSVDRSDLDRADAVVVHVYNMAPTRQNATIPARSRRSQIFVFFILESPQHSYDGFLESGYNYADVFNLTFTFLDSPLTDILSPMGAVRRVKGSAAAEGQAVSRRQLNKKTKLVAWFVSNCSPPSSRAEYAAELSRHVQVDVFGRCGNLTCALLNRTCLNEISRKYMFYLAFENSFCQDYATEKLYRTLKLQMVPIVYGYANYSKILPPMSYIDVRDFESPKALARYLLELKKDKRKYSEYFKWKRHYTVLVERDCKALGFCRLCSILHDDHYKYKSNFDPVNDYWNPKKLCLPRREERRVVHLSGR